MYLHTCSEVHILFLSITTEYDKQKKNICTCCSVATGIKLRFFLFSSPVDPRPGCGGERIFPIGQFRIYMGCLLSSSIIWQKEKQKTFASERLSDKAHDMTQTLLTVYHHFLIYI